jgi:cysteinyl-tRNA synthetase
MLEVCDSFRNDLKERNVILKDHGNGTTWEFSNAMANKMKK